MAPGRRIKGAMESRLPLLMYGFMVCSGYVALSYVVTYSKLVSRVTADRDHSLSQAQSQHQGNNLFLDNVTSISTSDLPKCRRGIYGLVGQITVNLTVPVSFDAIPALNKSVPALEVGGRWKPANCQSVSRLAVVMTYRNRSDNIKLMLQHLHPFLQKQQIEYQMFIVEPPDDVQFNRGMLKNIGFMESIRLGNFDCVVFHDIDLLPENDKNFYRCPDMPRHLVVAINTGNYTPLYGGAFFGGAVLFRTEHFKLVNGYSNLYFGWGGEDDDLKSRVHDNPAGLGVIRPHRSVARYVEAPHGKDRRSPTTYGMYVLRKYRYRVDGLNSLQYMVNDIKLHPTYTWLHVSYDEAKYIKHMESARKEAIEKEKLAEEKKKLLTTRTLSNSKLPIGRAIIGTTIPHRPG